MAKAKKAQAKRKTLARKLAKAPKSAARKVSARKPAARKTTTRKTTARKAPARKTSARKAPARKSATRAAAPGKVAGQKPARPPQKFVASHLTDGSFEDGLRRLGFTSLSLGIFEEPGHASEKCRLLAAFEPGNRPMLQAHFPSRDFSAPGVFEHEREPLLVQALVYEGEPIGLLTVPLGRFHTSLYEQMRETLAIGLRGFRLATGSV